jgi:hypothetical protein
MESVALAESPLPRRHTQRREQRAAPRIPCTIPLAVERHGRRSEVAMSDLSASGCAASLPDAVELGEVVTISFDLPAAPGRIRCAGLVRGWRTVDGQRRVGFEFHNLDPASRRAIAAYVKSQLPTGGAPRRHWVSVAPAGEAWVVGADERGRTTVRWAPGLVDLFREVASHLLERDTVFVPLDTAVPEGERVFLEVVPPASHTVVRVLAEVIWQQDDEGHGVGLRLAGLSPLDRHTLQSMLKWFKAEAERYR